MARRTQQAGIMSLREAFERNKGQRYIMFGGKGGPGKDHVFRGDGTIGEHLDRHRSFRCDIRERRSHTRTLVAMLNR